MLQRYDEGEVVGIESLGGPLILIDRQWLSDWQGYPDPAWPFDAFGTDYARACAVDDLLGLIAVGPGFALILGDEPLPTAWWPQPDRGGGIIVRWSYAPDEAAVFAALSRLPSFVWTRSTFTLPLPTGRAEIFDTVFGGEELEASLTLDLPQWMYHVDTAEYERNAGTALLLHRLTPDTAD